MADADRRLIARFAGLSGTAVLVFFAAAFLLPNENTYALVFYAAVLPALCLDGWRDVAWREPAVGWGLALVVWSGATLFWGIDDGHRTARFALGALSTAGLLLAMAATLRSHATRRRLGDILIGCGAANAMLSIILFFIMRPSDPRLHGWGATIHPILGAAVMAMAYVTALARGLAERRWRLANLGAALAMAVFILMTESRGPLLASAVATLFVCGAGRWRWWAYLGLAGFVAGWEALPTAVQQHSTAVLVQRGSSHRFEIWQYTAGLIRDRPLFGHGLAANLHFDADVPITFPHDLYLSLLFYSGVVGLVLFAGLASLLTWRLLLAWRRPEWPWLMGLWLVMLCAGLTDLGQITKGPGPLWLIVWLPVGLVMGATAPARKEALLLKKRSKNFS